MEFIAHEHVEEGFGQRHTSYREYVKHASRGLSTQYFRSHVNELEGLTHSPEKGYTRHHWLW